MRAIASNGAAGTYCRASTHQGYVAATACIVGFTALLCSHAGCNSRGTAGPSGDAGVTRIQQSPTAQTTAQPSTAVAGALSAGTAGTAGKPSLQPSAAALPTAAGRGGTASRGTGTANGTDIDVDDVDAGSAAGSGAKPDASRQASFAGVGGGPHDPHDSNAGTGASGVGSEPAAGSGGQSGGSQSRECQAHAGVGGAFADAGAMACPTCRMGVSPAASGCSDGQQCTRIGDKLVCQDVGTQPKGLTVLFCDAGACKVRLEPQFELAFNADFRACEGSPSEAPLGADSAGITLWPTSLVDLAIPLADSGWLCKLPPNRATSECIVNASQTARELYVWGPIETGCNFLWRETASGLDVSRGAGCHSCKLEEHADEDAATFAFNLGSDTQCRCPTFRIAAKRASPN